MSTKKRWLNGYKVVLRDDSSTDRKNYYKSSYCYGYLACAYGVKQITERPKIKINGRYFVGGPLCVFSKLKDAARYNKNVCFNAFIFKCKYLKSDDTLIWYPGQKKNKCKSGIRGKVLADEVILIQRVFKKDLKAKGLI
mgnify:CR=1 FL=1